MKDRVVFEANLPVTVTLAYADGLKVQGRFGDQVMYSLTDGRVMYVPPIVRDKLLELGIRQNEPFAICRAERREGNRRFVGWLVQPNGSGTPSQLEAVHSDMPDPPPANDRCVARAKSSSNGNGSGNGNPVRTPTASSTAETALRSALMASIDAALAAEQYASAHGLSVRFGSEDLRAMALSLFIQHARDGGVRCVSMPHCPHDHRQVPGPHKDSSAVVMAGIIKDQFLREACLLPRFSKQAID